jgi:autotransporter translocation and assembly factor TamB
MRILRTAALVLVALVALLVGGTWVFLQTPWGGEAVRRLALPRLNAAIAGRIAADRFRFHGDRIVLEGAVVRDPAGAQVLSVERIEIAFSPLALLRRRVEVTELAVEGPRLWLVAEAKGTNLARALAPRRPAAHAAPTASSQSRGPGWVVDVAGIALTDGAFAYGGPSGKRVARLDDLAVRGRVRLAPDGAAPRPHDILDLDLATDARGAHLVASGSVDLTTLRARDPGLVVRGEGIVLSDLLAAAPSSHFGFVLRVEGGGATLPELDGRVTLRVPEGEIDGQTLGPIAFSLQAAAGAYKLADLQAAFPGVAITGEASATNARVDGRLRVEARDLAATVRSLAPPRGPPPLGLAGKGRIDVAVSGPLARPALRVAARFPSLRLDDNELDDLHLSAIVPDVSRPTRATVDAGAAQATLGGQAVRALALRLDAAGQDLVAELRAAAPYPLALAATARRGKDDNHLVLKSFALRYPEGAWTLKRPARIAFADGRLTVRELALSADHQTIAVDLTRTDTRLEGHVEMARIDLARLPRVLVPKALGLRGEVDLDARLDERPSRPRLALTVALRRLILHQRAIGDLRLRVDGDGNKPLAAALDVSGLGGGKDGSLSVKLTTPLSLRTVLRHPPTTARLLRTPVEVTGDLDRLPLKTVAMLVGRKPEPEGTLSSHFEISGSAAEPRGQLALDVAGASVGARFPPTDARVEVDLAGRSIDARVRVVRRQHALLSLTARLEAGLDALTDVEQLASAPLKVRAVVGPLALQRLGLPPSERQPPRVLKGKVHADLAIDGTLRAPRLLAHAQLHDCYLDKALVGAGTVTVSYAASALRVETSLTSTSGGTLNLAAATTADLGYPAIRSLDPDKLVLDARLDAKEFDLQGLSGMTPGLRTVGGRLSAAATLRGTLDDPRVAGQLEWRDGRLALTGYGEYEGIHLALHGDEKAVRIDDLVGRAGHGNARLTGGAQHVDGKGYEVQLKADVTRFPLYTEGQPLAEVTIDAAVKGSVSPRVTRLAVDLDQARIALSSAKRKNLQALAAPADVVLMEDGKPLNDAQAHKLKKLEARREGETAAGAPTKERERKARTVITVNAPRRLWVTGQDANLELGLEPGFRVVIGETTRIIGTVDVHRARVDVFGRRFDVRSDSTVKFDGAPDFPDIDVTATHRNTTENVTVLATVKGTPDKMSVKVTSPDRPELTESQLYTLLITGHLETGGSGTTSGSPTAQAASLLGGVLASQLQKTLARRLPLDVLTIDAGGQGLAGTQLEAGRYVTDRFYVGYIGRVGADPNRYQNRNAVHLEYQLTSRWEVEGEYGDVGTGSADLMWKKNY